MEKPNGSERPQVLSMEAIPLFQEGLSLVLSNWSALKIAIDNDFAGRNTRALALAFSTDIFHFLHNPRRKEQLYIDDLEDFLDDGMIRLNTVVEDGSIEEVADKLMEMYQKCLEGDYELIHQLKEVKPPPVVTHVKQNASDSDEDEDEDAMENDDASNMMVDSPYTNCAQAQQNEVKHQDMVEAEDGWNVVHSRKYKCRGRRN